MREIKSSKDTIINFNSNPHFAEGYKSAMYRFSGGNEFMIKFDSEFEEKHPRSADGKFGKGGENKTTPRKTKELSKPTDFKPKPPGFEREIRKQQRDYYNNQDIKELDKKIEKIDRAFSNKEDKEKAKDIVKQLILTKSKAGLPAEMLDMAIEVAYFMSTGDKMTDRAKEELNK